MFIKVCGMTRSRTPGTPCASGATALGFVFWPRSPRYVTPGSGRMIDCRRLTNGAPRRRRLCGRAARRRCARSAEIGGPGMCSCTAMTRLRLMPIGSRAPCSRLGDARRMPKGSWRHGRTRSRCCSTRMIQCAAAARDETCGLGCGGVHRAPPAAGAGRRPDAAEHRGSDRDGAPFGVDVCSGVEVVARGSRIRRRWRIL